MLLAQPEQIQLHIMTFLTKNKLIKHHSPVTGHIVLILFSHVINLDLKSSFYVSNENYFQIFKHWSVKSKKQHGMIFFHLCHISTGEDQIQLKTVQLKPAGIQW